MYRIILAYLLFFLNFSIFEMKRKNKSSRKYERVSRKYGWSYAFKIIIKQYCVIAQKVNPKY